jgi:hypothetical protein
LEATNPTVQVQVNQTGNVEALGEEVESRLGVPTLMRCSPRGWNSTNARPAKDEQSIKKIQQKGLLKPCGFARIVEMGI